VNYNENNAASSESIPCLIKIDGAHAEGGFRVVPAEDQTNSRAKVFQTLWKDAGSVELTDSSLQVLLRNECQGELQFHAASEYLFFKSLFE